MAKWNPTTRDVSTEIRVKAYTILKTFAQLYKMDWYEMLRLALTFAANSPNFPGYISDYQAFKAETQNPDAFLDSYKPKV